MFSFLIISNSNDICAEVNKAFCAIGAPRKEGLDRLALESKSGMKNGWIAFQPIKNIEYDYEDKELEEINKIIKNSLFYLVEGRDEVSNFSNRFILEFKSSGDLLIDNDHGMISNLMGIKKMVESGIDWLHLSRSHL